jgi:hypothetical protein
MGTTVAAIPARFSFASTCRVCHMAKGLFLEPILIVIVLLLSLLFIIHELTPNAVLRSPIHTSGIGFSCA